jgi:hypothetical protein
MSYSLWLLGLRARAGTVWKLALLMVSFSLGMSTLLLVTAVPAYSHGGGLDANGCHNDRKRGGYHCHRAQAVEKDPVNNPKSGFIEQKPSLPEAPVTHIGPRGGRYHYSTSGKKVYERRR